MKKSWITKTFVPALAVLVLTAGTSAGKAMAYFTTCASGAGRVQVDLAFGNTSTDDKVESRIKHISIQNSSPTEDCYVRVKVLVADAYQDSVKYSSASGKWTRNEADGYWYYDTPLKPEEKTDELLAGLELTELPGITDEEDREIFNIIVVPEYTAVVYDDENRPYGDWDAEAVQEGVVE